MQKLTKTIIKLKLQILLVISGILIAPMVVFAVVQSLNGQSGKTQTFSNDTNVSMISSNNTHSLGWNGILSMPRGGTGASSFTGGSILFSNSTSITQNNSNLFWDNVNLRLGIGTAQPTSTLDVAGDVSVSGNFRATSLISTNDSIIHSLTVGMGGGSNESNTAIGIDALARATPSSHSNTAVGRQALSNQEGVSENTAVGYQALADNNNDQNTAVGSHALRYNNVGGSNVAVGANALRANTTKNSNTAVGYGALFFANAQANTAIGKSALEGLQTGDYNVALGAGAGSKQWDDTPLTTTQNSVYIGTSAWDLNNSDNNSIVIGSFTTGAGANTAVIGNSSVSDVYFGSSAGLAKIHAANIATVSSGISAPSSIPAAIGQIYIDTSVAKVYISTGTSSSSDWTVIN